MTTIAHSPTSVGYEKVSCAEREIGSRPPAVLRRGKCDGNCRGILFHQTGILLRPGMAAGTAAAGASRSFAVPGDDALAGCARYCEGLAVPGGRRRQRHDSRLAL